MKPKRRRRLRNPEYVVFFRAFLSAYGLDPDRPKSIELVDATFTQGYIRGFRDALESPDPCKTWYEMMGDAPAWKLDTPPEDA